jgi:ABC-type sugar transport system ATPase subunit
MNSRCAPDCGRSDKPTGKGALSIAGSVDTVEPLGHTMLVRAKMASGKRLNVPLASKASLEVGQPVHAIFTPNRVYLFDRKSEHSLLGVSE